MKKKKILNIEFEQTNVNKYVFIVNNDQMNELLTEINKNMYLK